MLNPHLKVGEVSVTSIKDGKAVITVNPESKIYASGSITVTYLVERLIDLDTVINTRTLGEFNDNPTALDILQRFGTLNPLVDTQELVVDSLDLNAHLAIVKVKDGSTSYLPKTITLTFTVKE